MKVSVRSYDVKDLDAIQRIRAWAVENTTALWDFEPETREEIQLWVTRHLDFGTVLVAEDESGQCVGLGALGPWRSNAGYLHTAENSIYVDPSFHRFGVGKALLAALQQAAVELDFHVVVAEIEATNEASIRLHERMGFTLVGITREAGWKWGRWLDLATMQWIVATP